MRLLFCIILLCGTIAESAGQLVTRKDYDAAFALQAGGVAGTWTSLRKSDWTMRPVAGLKMTFPITRKWFFGSEIDYRFKAHQLQVPLYLKYMLPCNRASLLFGGFGSYVFHAGKSDAASRMQDWNAGVTVGYEQRIIKHLELLCRFSVGCRKAFTDFHSSHGAFPMQLSLTVSYDILRIGDCGCD